MNPPRSTLSELLASGQRADLHWFPEDVPVSTLSETMAAMANTRGGQVLVGISPRSGKVLGLENSEETIDRVFQAALRTDPPLVLPLPKKETLDGQDILRVEIPEGLPHIYVIGGRYLGREHKHNTPIPAAALRQKLIERGVVHFEARPVTEADVSALDLDRIDDYAQQVGAAGGEEDPLEILQRRGCLMEVAGVLRPTQAGLLIFGKDPQRWASNAFILAARFKDTTLSDVFIKDEIRGRLPDQLQAAERFVADNLQTVVRMTGLVRKEGPEYPLAAVRELLVNAVAHRDYSVQGDSIHLHMFSNRLLIQSPGVLPGPVTLTNLLEARFSRNPIIVQVLSDMGYIERLGYGINRVLNVLDEHELPPPVFQESAGTFRVSLSNAFQPQTARSDRITARSAELNRLGLNERQKKAVDFVFANERITNRDFQEISPGVHAETLRRDLADLVKKQVLLKIGSKRGTHYILKEGLE